MMKKTVNIKKLQLPLAFLLLFTVTACTNAKRTTANAIDKAAQQPENIRIQTENKIPENIKAIKPSHTVGVQTGRYSSIRSKPTSPQRDLLQVMITLTIPDEITRVGETLGYVLKRSGYQLQQPKPNQHELNRLFVKRLPNVHRQLGPMTLEDALTILVAPAFLLQEDPVHRLISYQLNEDYAGVTL